MTERLSTDDIFASGKSNFDENYKIISSNIEEACSKIGKNADDIQVLAATKTVPVQIINYALSHGIKLIGENKVQELNSKYDELDAKKSQIHLIGHLQTNKVSQVVGKVDMIQSVDSVHLASEISKRSLMLNQKTKILIEVNVGGEESKSGISPEQTLELAEQISEFKGIQVSGLMTIPPIEENITKTRRFFSLIYKLFVDIRSKKSDNVYMDYLSMGMSSDYAEAILEGANMVRIGTAFFGKRDYSKK